MKSWHCEVSFEGGKLQHYLKDEAAYHKYCSQAMIVTDYLKNIRCDWKDQFDTGFDKQ